MSDQTKKQAAADACRDAYFNGESYMGQDSVEGPDEAFLAGVSWRDQNPSAEVATLVFALRAANDQMDYYHEEIKVPISWQDVHQLIKIALANYRKAKL